MNSCKKAKPLCYFIKKVICIYFHLIEILFSYFLSLYIPLNLSNLIYYIIIYFLVYHWVEVNVKMRMLNLGKPTEVPKLNETMAIELGADLLGEATIFMIAVLTLTAEYVRNSRNEKAKEAGKEARFKSLENDIDELKYVIDKQNVELLHLTRMYNSLEDQFRKDQKKK